MNPNDLQEMMQRAQQMQTRMAEVQQQLAARTFTASSGGGMVEASVSGALRIVSVEIEPSLFESGDRGMIQDLVAAAINAALTKAQEGAQKELADVQQSLLAGLGG